MNVTDAEIDYEMGLNNNAVLRQIYVITGTQDDPSALIPIIDGTKDDPSMLNSRKVIPRNNQM